MIILPPKKLRSKKKMSRSLPPLSDFDFYRAGAVLSEAFCHFALPRKHNFATPVHFHSY